MNHSYITGSNSLDNLSWVSFHIASQEAITERLEDNPSAGIDYSVMGTTASTEPLITITQEVKYTVVIKGTTFTFTQDELDALTEELLGFTTL